MVLGVNINDTNSTNATNTSDTNVTDINASDTNVEEKNDATNLDGSSDEETMKKILCQHTMSRKLMVIIIIVRRVT